MTYVITQDCCSDASCVAECPVDCIRPSPADRQAFAAAEMLYIDPDSCIDCGACQEACPVGAAVSEVDLPAPLSRFAEFNAEYFVDHPLEPSAFPPRAQKPDPSLGVLTVAIVGAGPAGAYVAESLLELGNVQITLIDSLPTPWGLLRSGVAADHQHTKRLTSLFERTASNRSVELWLNVEVGKDVSLSQLRESHHAVVVATGASSAQSWNVPGNDLANVWSAGDFVGWVNGHPAHAGHTIDLNHDRVVIVGNGNVALDMARILTLGRDELEGTDVAPHALESLRLSKVREVVILGRRGPLQAAYTSGEFHALGHLDDVDVVVDPSEVALDPVSSDLVESGRATFSERLKATLAKEYAERPDSRTSRRIVFRYLVEPVAVRGDRRAESVTVARTRLESRADGAVTVERTEEREVLTAGLVLTSIGNRGAKVDGLPFDTDRGVLPSVGGRVQDAEGSGVPGVYAAGWITRGAQGGLGTNRLDAADLAGNLVSDFNAGSLFRSTLATGVPSLDTVGYQGWKNIDHHELRNGSAVGRPRVKVVSVEELLAIARDQE